jgi:uncharacterized protein
MDQENPSAAPDAPAEVETNNDAKMWAMICHLAGLAGYVVPVPFIAIIAPLIVWQMKKDEFEFVDDQGKEAVNFHITMLIAALVAAATICIAIGFVLLPLVLLFSVVMAIVAAIKANGGERYRYPLTLRLIK